MLEGLKYLFRLLAAVILFVLSVIFCVLAACDPKSRAFGLSLAGVFGFAGVFTWPRRPNAWRSDQPTERQIAYAKDLGIQIRRGMSKGDISDLISDAKAVHDSL